VTQVNNAGVAMVAPLELIPEAEFAFVMDVNVLGPLRVTQCFLPLLKKAPRARIVNVGSQVSPGGTLRPYNKCMACRPYKLTTSVAYIKCTTSVQQTVQQV
jgi:NAD(P)-dependent dehydrogenase (short-subunit alcohol dehydrogenase family)